MIRKRLFLRGFTLIEVLVVVSIILILSTIVLASLGESSKKGRDAKRQADLLNLQAAVEQYRMRYGRYPEAGCSSPLYWSTESVCDGYITGATIGGSVKPFTPDFIQSLPHDPMRNGNEGYSYIVNKAGTVYKIMAMNTVESETVGYLHPLRSCDLKSATDTDYPTCGGAKDCTTLGVSGMCSYLDWNWLNLDYPTEFSGSLNVPGQGSTRGESSDCKISGNSRFTRSYGVWGGFASEFPSDAKPRKVADTSSIICR